jgi:hypothetical protein
MISLFVMDLCDAWRKMKLTNVMRFAFANSVGSPYGDPDQLDASLGSLTQQRQQEVLLLCFSGRYF